MPERQRLLTIAGHDPVNGAGITADFAAWRAHGHNWKTESVIAALTVQSAEGLSEVQPVDSALLARALQALLRDGEFSAIKIGMVGSAANAVEIAQFLQARACPVVFDPVLAASNGTSSLDAPDAERALAPLLQRADLVTPNRPEAERLWGTQIFSGAAPALPAPCRAVLFKGGHGGGAEIEDWLVTAQSRLRFTTARLPQSTHGSGCVHSAHLTALLAAGMSLADAAVEAQWRAHAGIRLANAPWEPPSNFISLRAPSLPASPPPSPPTPLPITGEGRNAGNASGFLSPVIGGESPKGERGSVSATLSIQSDPIKGRANTRPDAQADHEDLPRCNDALPALPSAPFAALHRFENEGAIFYPIVDSADWVARLLDCGVSMMQLRIKNRHGAALQNEIARAMLLCKERGSAQQPIRLFINDHWREALACGAYGVHLGQEDLQSADLRALQSAGLRLGVSSHSPLEMARANACQPSYAALGAVFPTNLKIMPTAPLGLPRLAQWAALYRPRIPVFAIGGINETNAAAALATGVQGISVVSAVTQAAVQHEAVARLLQLCRAAPSASP